MATKVIDKKKTGNNIYEAMKRKEITVIELAEMLGISFQSVYKYIHGINLPDINRLFMISRILDTTVDDLIAKKDHLL